MQYFFVTSVWLENKQLRKVVLVISDIQSKEILERWQFDIEQESETGENGYCFILTTSSDEMESLCLFAFRGDTSVTFLPLLEKRCSFDVLTYTGKQTDTPENWTESSTCVISDAEEIQLRSFSTGLHSVHAKVAYKTSM
ncbi:unnamed protein product [Gongylonema pulchrum]|uniref:HORMA domain-containing protein n=1 Tax=Gongylonema pulchrum TaxID=637853 RepID=A0A183EQQ1_9BILA|nr:unnamed protein product [Gongylonema pulchrum]